MRFTQRCPKCGSPNVSEQHPRITGSNSYFILTNDAPDERISLPTAWVCPDCGFTALHRSHERGERPRAP